MPSEASTFRGDQSVEQLRRELAEAREQQAATAAILAAISNSPIDSYRVFAEIAASAARLCEAYDAVIFQVDGAVLRLVAHEGPVSLGPVGQFTVPLVRGSLSGRVTLVRRTSSWPTTRPRRSSTPRARASRGKSVSIQCWPFPCNARAKRSG